MGAILMPGPRTLKCQGALRVDMNGSGQPGAGQGGGSGVLQPTFNMPVTVVNNGSEKLQATTRQSPDGIDVLLEPMVRKAVGKMGSDGSLAKSYQQTPRGKTR